MPLGFLEEINRKRSVGYTAFLFQFNVNDRYFEPGKPEPPLPLRLLLAAKFPNHEVGYFSQSTGLMPLVPPGKKAQNVFAASSPQELPTEALNRALRILRGGERRLLIADFIGLTVPNASDEMLHPDDRRIVENFVRVGQDDELRKLDSFLVGVNYTRNVHDLVRRSWHVISIPLPSEDDRKAYYELLSNQEKFARIDPTIEDAEYVSLSRACRLRDIENLLRQAHAENRHATREDFNAVREATLHSLVGELLVVRKPSGLTFDDVYGMDSFKNYVLSVVRAVRQGKHALAPGGILLQGLPGTGKTYIVDAIASAFGYTILEWRNLKSMWLGQSEANLEAALQAIEAMNPVLVLVDEADQLLSGRQEGRAGDGGTGGYMFGRLLNFMGDGRMKGRVMWVLCSNRPDLIDPALADRVGCCVPLLRPGKGSIPGILASLTKQIRVEVSGSETELRDLVERLPRDVSIRKLKDLVGLAALYADGSAVKAKDLHAAIDDLLFNEDEAKIAFWTCLAVRMATYSSLLPWKAGKPCLDCRRAASSP